MRADDLLQLPFAPFSDVLKARALAQPQKIALSDGERRLSWGEFDAILDSIGAKLQAEGVKHGDVVAIAGHNSIGYALVYCATVRVGAVAAVLTSSATPEAIAAMLRDCGARHLFLDAPMGAKLAGQRALDDVALIAFDDSDAGVGLSAWMAAEGKAPARVEVAPDDVFNIIYSSGTTGAPKGIVQSHAMRAAHIRAAASTGYTPDAVSIMATPLYSNTTLVSFLPTLAMGGRVVLMPKFDARRFCGLCESERVTHAMLVPVQYQRIMAMPDFDRFDLSSFRYKSSTSAPFSPALKQDVLRRWPGVLVEIYGMTEGGGVCILNATEFPNKLHTVGRAAPGHDIRIIDEDGAELPLGAIGEVVGRSAIMMNGYHNRETQSRESEWFDAEGHRFIRHGDIGRFDEDGFLILMDRSKDLIISGGFNIYPSDLEAVLIQHPNVLDAAVVGAPSEAWGETPVAFVVLRDCEVEPSVVLAAVNARLGATQRISLLYAIDEIPRNAIGKILKKDLRLKIRF